MASYARALPAGALRRPAAAGGDRPRAGDPAQGPAARRAAVGTRRAVAQRHAERDRAAASRTARRDDPLRDARSDRGADPRRSHRGDEREPARGRRHRAVALSAAAVALHGDRSLAMPICCRSPSSAATKAKQQAWVRLGPRTLWWSRRSATRNRARSRMLCIRPHALALEPHAAGDNTIEGTVTEVQWRGSAHRLYLDVDGVELCADSKPLRAPPTRGQRVSLHFAPHDATLLGASDGPAAGSGPAIPDVDALTASAMAAMHAVRSMRTHATARVRRCRAGSGSSLPLLVLAASSSTRCSSSSSQSLMGDAGPASTRRTTRRCSRRRCFKAALLRTIQIAVLSTIGCLVLGFVLALIVSFVPFPGARVVSGFIDTILAFPSFLIALSFTFLYGSAGAFNFIFMDLLHTTQPPIDFVYSNVGRDPRRGHVLHAVRHAAVAGRRSRSSTRRWSRWRAASARGRCASCARSSFPRRFRRCSPAAACACC